MACANAKKKLMKKSKLTFSEKVYKFISKIPKGKVSTYKEVAKFLKCRAYRAVGNALNKNPYTKIPCHRIIKSNGEVGGFATGTNKKIKMLKKEGVEIKNGKIDFKKYQFTLKH